MILSKLASVIPPIASICKASLGKLQNIVLPIILFPTPKSNKISVIPGEREIMVSGLCFTLTFLL